MTRKILVAMAVVAAAVTTSTASGGAAQRYSGFTAHVDNPWFPLLAGTQYRYTGVKDGKPSRDIVTVTNHTKTIDGAQCVVVHDRLYLRSRLAERTTDWYSQDPRGNVWYFGENTVELDAHGHVTNNQGTWKAGVNGARPGIYMPAAPRVGQSGQQEYYKGQAEDHYKVIGLFRTVTTSGAKHILLTKEWTPLEPGVIDHKMYAFDIGTVLEQTEKGPEERNELVAVIHR